MTIEKERLLSLIEYAQQSARLRTKPVSTIAQHNEFVLYEHQLRDRPGISLNIEKDEGEDEVWLVVKRLHETKPPEVTSTILVPWIEMTKGPESDPKLKTSTDGASLITAGTHRSSTNQKLSDQQARLPQIDPHATILLEAYQNQNAVKAHFEAYLENKWRGRIRKGSADRRFGFTPSFSHLSSNSREALSRLSLSLFGASE